MVDIDDTQTALPDLTEPAPPSDEFDIQREEARKAAEWAGDE